MNRYFRNKHQMSDILPDTLWRLEGDVLVLEDEDEFLTLDFDEFQDLFYEVAPRGNES